MCEVDGSLITAIQGHSGATRPIWLMPILESALGHRECVRHRTRLGAHRRHHHRAGGLHRRPRRGEDRRRSRIALRAHARGQCRPRRDLQAIDSVYGDVADTEDCCAGAKLRAPWDSKAWAAFIRCRLRSSIAPLRPRRGTGEGAEDRCGLRRSAGPRAGRGEPRLQDD